MPEDNSTMENASFRIALDGPSALALYRDRDNLAQTAQPTPSEQSGTVTIDQDEYTYLSDEDIAATLADTNVFGGRPLDALATQGEESIGIPELKRSQTASFARCATRSRDLKLINYDAIGLTPPTPATPLYLMAPNSAAVRRVRNVHQRACTSKLPANSLRLLGKNVLVPTPEFTFLLLARHLKLPQLIMVGMELCGHYRMAGATTHALLKSNTTVYNCRQLTTPANLQSFLADVLNKPGAFPGSELAMRACTYLAPNSASPMESIIYLLLCLPQNLGGYALPQPTLNAKRAVNSLAGSFTMSLTLIPDLYWSSARLDLEYDSDEFHSDPESLQRGARRTMALRAMHVDVISMTNDMVRDENAFDATARLIARRLGKRIRTDNKNAPKKRSELRKLLL